jgi:hypothetical protein
MMQCAKINQPIRLFVSDPTLNNKNRRRLKEEIWLV